ncbi:MAG: HAD family hydrolase [Spirochaetaceae bacterium]|nr:HAD family hydrolase [Spirochaetaceae bacterium]
MLSDIKAVIFDLDGTLYNFKWLPLRLMWSLPTDVLRIKADREVRKKLKGCDLATPEAYLAEYGRLMAEKTDFKSHDALNWYANRYMGTMCFLLKRYYSQRPQLAEVFARLHQQKIKIAVFSDYPRVHQRIRALDFSDETMTTISGIFSAQDFGSQKPAPRPFLEIASQLGVKPEQCLVVGDRDDTDGDGARATGMNFIQIETHKTKIIEAHHPVWSWEDFAKWVLEGMEPLED